MSLPGLAEAPELRRGNISISGVYFDVNRRLAELGDVQALHIESLNRGRAIDVVAQLVRVIACDDAWRGSRVAGLAFEFLFESFEQQQQIEEFVRGVASWQLSQSHSLQVDYDVDARVVGHAQRGETATIRQLAAQRWVIEVSWPVAEGEVIRFEIQAPASQHAVRLSGRAVQVTRIGADGPYRVAVAVGEEELAATAVDVPGRPVVSEGSIARALEALVAQATAWQSLPEPAPRQGLRGLIANVRLSSLLAIVSMERLTGVLRVRRGGGLLDQAEVLVRGGEVLDVDSTLREDTALATLKAVQRWTDGSFELTAGSIADRPSAVGMSTAELLVQLAKSAADGPGEAAS